MGRRELREHLFRLLFLLEFHKQEEWLEQLEYYFELDFKEVPTEQEIVYLKERAKKVQELQKEIDTLLENISTGWKLERMGKVDITILRLAVYEMKYDDTIPIGVAINEAVELAKKFGEENSKSFVNGILAKAVES